MSNIIALKMEIPCYLQKTFSFNDASSSPPLTNLFVALQVSVFPLSQRVGLKVNVDVELFPSSVSYNRIPAFKYSGYTLVQRLI